MGAWIETQLITPLCSLTSVAPFMGAWIETEKAIGGEGGAAVAPFMGAWIETSEFVASMTAVFSRSLHGSVD